MRVARDAPASFSASFNAANQIESVGGVSAAVYDADGNLLSDPTQGTAVVNAYDAEGHAVGFKGGTLTYDALGRAVEASVPGNAFEWVWGPGGRRAAVMQGQALSAAYVGLPGGGSAMYVNGGGLYYLHADAGGSARMFSTSAGAMQGAVG